MKIEKQITLTVLELRELIGEAWKAGYYANKSISMTVEITKDVKALIRSYIEEKNVLSKGE